MKFSTDFTLTGVGAPVHIFLDDVAKMLGTKAVLPKHYEVANALGAIVSNVYVSSVVEIKPNYTVTGITGYTVYGNSGIKVFEDLAEAEKFAVEEAKSGAYAEARNRGAQGEVTVTCTINKNEADAKECAVYLGSQAIARAAGGLGF
jgi:hypothetical protein